MLFKIFSVFDNSTMAYLQPMFFVSKGQCIRAVTEAVADKDHNFSKYAHEYVLFELGSFDDGSCHFDLFDAPRSVGVLSEFVPPVLS